ncbi:MAG: cytidylate kinase-like family protein [Nitrospirota bacterium]
MKKGGTIVITISRQEASGGSYIGHLVARRLDFKYFDRDILYEASKYLEVNESEISSLEEKPSSFFEKLLRAFSFEIPEVAYMPPSRPIYDRDLFDIESKIINEIAERYNAVIIGRGGFYVLRGHPGLVNVFVHAPLNFRIKRIMEVRNISDRDKALSEIEESDRNREKFIRDMTGVNWTDARNYHLCIDTSAVSFTIAEEMIVKLVESIRYNLGL